MAERRGRRSFGSVRKLPSGRFQAMYSHPDTGSRVKALAPFQTRGDATRWLAKVEVDLHSGDLLDPNSGTITFGEFSDTWLADRVHLRPKTMELYEYLLRVHISPTFGSVPINRSAVLRSGDGTPSSVPDRSATPPLQRRIDCSARSLRMLSTTN